MGIFQKFPYTDDHQLNLDWILRLIKTFKGGSAGQMLSKRSSKDYDFEWSNAAQGPEGPQGPQGIQGPAGPQGPAATINIGNTVTGAPGTAAAVENVGTDSAAILNFTIPKGEKGDPGMIVEADLSYAEFYPQARILYASISSNTGKINSNQNCRTLYIPCYPNAKYKVKKTAGTRFTVGWTDVLPAANVMCQAYVTDNTASELEITTGNNAAYLVVFCFYSSSDTGITATEMTASVEFYVYISHDLPADFSFDIQAEDHAIYDLYNVPISKYLRDTSQLITQDIVRYSHEFYVFGSSGKIRKYFKNSTPITQTLATFEHPFSAEFADGEFIVTSAENYNASNEVRKVYFYDWTSNTITDSFTPSTPGKLIYAHKVDSDNFILCSWITNSYNLHFYTYNRTTSQYTEIGSYHAPRTFCQGMAVIGNLAYITLSDGLNAGRMDLMQIIDLSTMSDLDTFYLYGFNEAEGCDIMILDGSILYNVIDQGNSQIWTAKIR